MTAIHGMSFSARSQALLRVLVLAAIGLTRPAAALTVRPPGDANSNGHVDGQDILMVINAWGLCPPIGSCPADIASTTSYPTDGSVNVKDLLTVIQNFGS